MTDMQLRLFAAPSVPGARPPRPPRRTKVDPLTDLDFTELEERDEALRRRVEADRAVRPACRCDRPVLAPDGADEPRCFVCGRWPRGGAR